MKKTFFFLVLLMVIVPAIIAAPQPLSTRPSVTPKGEPIVYINDDMVRQVRLDDLLISADRMHKFLRRLEDKYALGEKKGQVNKKAYAASLDTLRQMTSELSRLCISFDHWLMAEDPGLGQKKIHLQYFNGFQTINFSWQMPKKIGKRDFDELIDPIYLEDKDFNPIGAY
ncbi:MAG: hypothetical protein V1838_05640 [Patescibacteria group bacterium]